jgi:hypothetical protein
MRVWAIMLALALVAGARITSAEEAASPSYRLQSATVGAGGAVGLRGPGPSPAVGSAGTTLGQSTPVGVSTGSTTGTKLEGGFWFTPEPGSAASGLAVVALLGGLGLARGTGSTRRRARAYRRPNPVRVALLLAALRARVRARLGPGQVGRR